MFKKNKINEEKKEYYNYKDWEYDFGFLNLIMNRKKNITKEFLINTFNMQKNDKDYLNDSEIEPIISDIVSDILESIGSAYKDFLIEKYFGTEEALLSFITEDCYIDIVSDAINRNNKKIQMSLHKQQMSLINNLNKKK